MTAPYGFVEASNVSDVPLDEMGKILPGEDPVVEYSKAILPWSDEQKNKLKLWLDGELRDLIHMQADKQVEFAQIEHAYRAKSAPPTDDPFVGACTDTIPAVAMAVEPVQARIETGIFKSDPIFAVKPIRKKVKKYQDALQKWMNFYFRNVLKFQSVAAPRIHEYAKLGTMVYKVPYVYEKCEYKTYDENNEVVSRERVKFRGPKPEGIKLGDFLFHPGYQHVQDCPIVAERQRTTLSALRALEAQGYLADTKLVDKLGTRERTDVEEARETTANHESAPSHPADVVLYECWLKWYESDTAKYPVSLVVTYEMNTRTILQLRYNPYFHQMYPYIVVPYSVANDSLYGIGIGEMAMSMQNSLTSLHRNSIDNTRIANMRMWAVKRGQPNTEDRIKVYTGKKFEVDDPSKDIVSLQMGDAYSSTITERQNLFGMLEKRTGVSDYMTGRESPALGSRATATSTMALIQEGTRRVEQVMENVRVGYNEIALQCMLIWAQYGLGTFDDYTFGDEETGQLLDQFFKSVITAENAETLLQMEVAVSDATTNRQIQQQMQMQMIQVMTQYLQQLVQAGQLMVQAQQQSPELAGLIVAVVEAGQKMYKDLLAKSDLPAAEDYLPDVSAFFVSPPAPVGGPGGGSQGGAPVPPGQPGMGVPQPGMASGEGGMPPEIEQLLSSLGGAPAAAG